MAKKKKVEQEDQAKTAEQPKEKQVELTDVAIGLAQIPETKKWVLVRIKYNASTGDVGELERQEMDDRGHGIERVKIEVANEVLTFD